MNRRTNGAGIILWLIVLTLLIAGCYIPQSVEPTAQPPVSDDPDALTGLPKCESEEGQILALGFEQEMRELLDQVSRELGIEYEVIDVIGGESIWLNGEQEAKFEETFEGDYRKPFDSFWRVEVVNTDDTEADDRFVEALRGRAVSASLDYKTHLFGHSGGDSPFGKEPFPAPMPPSGTPDMRAQSALAKALDVQAAIETPEPNGQDPKEIVVGVFDTAPQIRGVVQHEFASIQEQVGMHAGSVGWYAGTPTPWPNSRDHGVFVSSLVDAVAPESKVMLYRVLGDDGQGSTVDIFTQTLAFLAEYPPSAETPRVLNFSLGINCDEPPSQEWMLELSPFEALNVLLTEAELRGAVIVAAAGNDSNRLEQPHRDPYILPAAYPASGEFAIGVGATNLEGTPSCYSHGADVYAPGGDGASAPGPAPSSTPIPHDAVNHCVPNHTACTDATCEYGLLGLSAESPSGYAFWPGTSFATPLVSGLVARYLALHGDPLPPAPRQWIEGCAVDASGNPAPLSIGHCPAVP